MHTEQEMCKLQSQLEDVEKSVQKQTCEQFSRFLWMFVELSSDFPFDLKTGNMCVCVIYCHDYYCYCYHSIIIYDNRRGTWTMTNDRPGLLNNTGFQVAFDRKGPQD